MKKAIQIAYNESFEKKCRFANIAGFDGIAVNFTEFLSESEYEWEKATENIGRILEENNLLCLQSHPYYYDLRISSEKMEEKYEFCIKQAIIASGKLGASWCAMHPRSSVSTGFRKTASFEDNKKAFSSYLDVAHKYNTGIAIENLPVFHGLVPVMPFYSSDFDDLAILSDSFNDDKVGICWDTGHANLMCFKQADAIRFLGERIKCTHIHNNFGDEDHHNTPDTGSIPWGDVMKAFRDINYTGCLTLETHCRYKNSDALLENFARYNYECLEFLEELY